MTSRLKKLLIACHPDRPKKGYRIDFSVGDAVDYVPAMRLRCGINGQELYRPGWSIRLNPTHLAFMQHVNGERSIRQIAERVAQSQPEQS